jgi:PTH1 family peptidyl-tRNA hydrolase
VSPSAGRGLLARLVAWLGRSRPAQTPGEAGAARVEAEANPVMLVFVGLGNPGARYARHRHNIGLMAVEAIARRPGIGPWRRRFHGEAAEGVLGGSRVLLLKPQTYMNESGRAVAEAARFYKVEPANVVVFHDELDLPPAKLRVKLGGGNAGHNGLRSVSAHIGNDFRRVRIGIGHPGVKELVQPHVLGDFGKEERQWVEAMCDVIADNADLLAKGEDASFQNRVHLAMDAKGFGEPKRRGESVE